MQNFRRNILLSALFLLQFTISGPVTLAQKPLYVYDFGLQSMPVRERVNFLMQTGYKGVVFRVKTPDHLTMLDEYLDAAENLSDFSILAVYIPYTFSAPQSERDVWKAVTDKIASKGIILWPIFLGDPDKQTAITTLQEMADYTRSRNVQLVLYPHDNTYIESLSESVKLIKATGKTNIYSSFHLCHELRAGNKETLVKLAQTYAPFIRLATISGAEEQDHYDGKNGWSDTIKPLEESSYNIKEFLYALDSIHYKYEVVLHTFGIQDSSNNHLKTSLSIWQTIQ